MIEKVLSPNDPLNKGKISENIDFIVFQVEPYKQIFCRCILSTLNRDIMLFVIMSLMKSLGEEGLNRFKKDSLLTEDWDAIFNTME